MGFPVDEYTLLDAIEQILSSENRAMSAKQLVKELEPYKSVKLGGSTPWKTIGARLAVDIRSNPQTKFKRAGPGFYALAGWSDIATHTAQRRILKPLDEEIIVVKKDVFLSIHAKSRGDILRNITPTELIDASISMHRRVAEDTEDFVQIIPSFIVFREDSVLSYKRTKLSPENRLHDNVTIVFGGHLQAEDTQTLFNFDSKLVDEFLFRELHEELSFSKPFDRYNYCGTIYLQGSPFERQHAGIIFAIDLLPGTEAYSEEPGYHSSLQFIDWGSIRKSPVMNDSWSKACIEFLGVGNDGGQHT